MKAAIRDLWGLEYEIEEIQTEFAKGIGSIDINNLTDDFVEDVMLQSKPLQGILMAIRLRQKVTKSFYSSPHLDAPHFSSHYLQTKMEEVKQKYWDAIKDLEPLKLPRPPKPKAEEKKPEEKKEGEKKADAPPANPPSAEAAPAPVAEAKA